MARGDQVRALVIVSKAKGWDPTVIPEGPGADGSVRPAFDLAEWDKDPGTRYDGSLGGYCTGRLPQGLSMSYPEDHPEGANTEKISFSIPEVGRENADNRTSGADPYPGGGWQ